MKIKCPNVEASMYAQQQLHNLGIKIIIGKPHESRYFNIVFPPPYIPCSVAHSGNGTIPEEIVYGNGDYNYEKCKECRETPKDDKPVICSDDGKGKNREYTYLYKALKIMNFFINFEELTPIKQTK